MNNSVYYIMAICAGMLIPVQAATNALLTKATGHVFYSILILLCVGLLALISLILIVKPELPALRDLLGAPIFSLSGGVIVVIYMITITFISPKIGVGNAVVFIVGGQIFSASLIDQYGFIDSPVTSLSLSKLFGLLCIAVGLIITTYSTSAATS